MNKFKNNIGKLLVLGMILMGCTTSQNDISNNNLLKNKVKTIDEKIIENDDFYEQNQIRLEKMVFSDLKVVYTVNLFLEDETDTVVDLCSVDTEIISMDNHQEKVIASNFTKSNQGVAIETKVDYDNYTDPFYITSIITYDRDEDSKRNFHYLLVFEVKFNPELHKYEITEDSIEESRV